MELQINDTVEVVEGTSAGSKGKVSELFPKKGRAQVVLIGDGGSLKPINIEVKYLHVVEKSSPTPTPALAPITTAPATTPSASDLPDLTVVNTDLKASVGEMTEVEKNKSTEEYLKKKTFAERAGAMKVEIENNFKLEVKKIDDQIAVIKADPKLKLSSILQNHLTALKNDRERLERERDASLAKLEVKDKGIAEHVNFSAFLAGIVKTRESLEKGLITLDEARESAQQYFDEAEDDGRIEKTSTISGVSGLVFLDNQAYVQKPDNSEKDTRPNAAVANELRKLANAMRAAKPRAYAAAVGALKGKATSGLTLRATVPGTKGIIYAYLPPKERAGESHILVELTGREIKPVEAIGYFKSFFVELKTAGRNILIRDLVESRMTGPRIEDRATFEETLSFLKVLLAAKHAEREAATLPKTETTPLPATADTTTTTTETTEPAPKKKRAPRAKKITEAA